MDVSDFADQYSWLPDSELIALARDRRNLLPEAIPALESELHRRGFKGFDELDLEPVPTAVERPEMSYKWGKFIGGMTIIGGLGLFISGCIDKHWFVAIGGLYNFIVGFGVYEKKRIAVLLAEAFNILWALVMIAMFLYAVVRTEWQAAFLSALLFLIPGTQLLYFWKRRKELH